MTNWYGMLVPSTTPREVIVKLNAEVGAHPEAAGADRAASRRTA